MFFVRKSIYIYKSSYKSNNVFNFFDNTRIIILKKKNLFLYFFNIL